MKLIYHSSNIPTIYTDSLEGGCNRGSSVQFLLFSALRHILHGGWEELSCVSASAFLTAKSSRCF